MKRINKTDKKVLGKKKSTLTWFLYFDSGAKATASLMQRVVHFASYFLKLEFLIAICLSHLTLLSSKARKTFMLGVSDRFLARYT